MQACGSKLQKQTETSELGAKKGLLQGQEVRRQGDSGPGLKVTRQS